MNENANTPSVRRAADMAGPGARPLGERSALSRYTQLTFGWERVGYWVLLPLAGGIGLVTWALTKLPMRALVLILLALGIALWIVGRYRLDGARRAELARRVRIGISGGILATIAYDLARFGLVSLVKWSLQPWAAISLFGQLFIGPHHSTAALYAVGLTYHLCLNGIGFATAYTVIVERPHPVTGVLWAFGLEAAMALLYPTFLIIKQYGEFLTMSVVGHLCYGLVIGAWARHWLRRNPDAQRASAAPDQPIPARVARPAAPGKDAA